MTQWLIGTLIATNGLMAFVLILREPVRRLCGSRVAYALWLLPAVRAPFPSFSYTVERMVPATNANLAFHSTVPAVPVGMVSTSVVDQLGGWPTILIVLWLIGAAALLARGLAVYTVQRRAILAEGVEIAKIGTIRIVRSNCVGGPLAFGVFNRVVAVPLDFDQRFSEHQRSLTLEHELAHHRSSDLVANMIAFVLLCLQWFNPLAWVAHAAFRFDQEAACDARVLDRVDRSDRSSYGEAIAKAASGPALLFAGALDRPSTLSRRLTIMTRITNPKARKLGGWLIAGSLLAIPLTATWAATYVDVAAPIPPVARSTVTESVMPPVRASVTPQASRAVSTAAALPPAAAKLAALAPASTAAMPATPGEADISFIGKDTVRIHGQTKRWDELTGPELAEIRMATVKARTDLNRQIANLPEELAQVRKEAERFRSGEFKRQIIEARAGAERSLSEIELRSASLRVAGQDPQKMKADISKSLRELRAMDIDQMTRESLVSLDENKIRNDVMNAAKSLDEVERKLDMYQRR